MALELFYHPLASFCWKVLVALYENETAFEPKLVDLGSKADREALRELWPFSKFPVLRDGANQRVVPESTVIIEYLDHFYPGARPLLPRGFDEALETRLRDRLFDEYVHQPMQKVVLDHIRPHGKNDPFGVEQAKRSIETAYDLLERDMKTRCWAMGADFSLADCSAMPALYYANRVVPIGDSRPELTAYLARLLARPSCARVLREAEPFMHMVPG